jgi:hypothetical protein
MERRDLLGRAHGNDRVGAEQARDERWAVGGHAQDGVGAHGQESVR